MVTTKIEIKPHLKEYVIGKYNNLIDGPVSFPDNIDLYHIVWDFLRKRPCDRPIDRGNLEIILPNRREGKKPEVYNYLSKEATHFIEKKIEVLMIADLHTMIDESKHRHGITIKESVYKFMSQYGIDSISMDAFVKNYQRWKNNIRRRKYGKILQ